MQESDESAIFIDFENHMSSFDAAQLRLDAAPLYDVLITAVSPLFVSELREAGYLSFHDYLHAVAVGARRAPRASPNARDSRLRSESRHC